jgi:hypothetical protein
VGSAVPVPVTRGRAVGGKARAIFAALAKGGAHAATTARMQSSASHACQRRTGKCAQSRIKSPPQILCPVLL